LTENLTFIDYGCINALSAPKNCEKETFY